MALRPVLRNPCVLGEDLSCGDVSLDEAALVYRVSGRLQRLGVGRGPGEAAGEAKGGDDEDQDDDWGEKGETET